VKYTWNVPVFGAEGTVTVQAETIEQARSHARAKLYHTFSGLDDEAKEGVEEALGHPPVIGEQEPIRDVEIFVSYNTWNCLPASMGGLRRVQLLSSDRIDLEDLRTDVRLAVLAAVNDRIKEAS